MFTIYRANADELDAQFLESLKAAFKHKQIEITLSETDETEYLLRSPANREYLLKALEDVENNRNITIPWLWRSTINATLPMQGRPTDSSTNDNSGSSGATNSKTNSCRTGSRRSFSCSSGDNITGSGNGGGGGTSGTHWRSSGLSEDSSPAGTTGTSSSIGSSCKIPVRSRRCTKRAIFRKC